MRASPDLKSERVRTGYGDVRTDSRNLTSFVFRVVALLRGKCRGKKHICGSFWTFH